MSKAQDGGLHVALAASLAANGVRGITMRPAADGAAVHIGLDGCEVVVACDGRSANSAGISGRLDGLVRDAWRYRALRREPGRIPELFDIGVDAKVFGQPAFADSTEPPIDPGPQRA